MIWDTAGQDMFNALTRGYYKGAAAVVYVFSTTDKDSFQAVERWQERVSAECGDLIGVLVQSKVDLIDQAAVSSTEVEALARRMRLKLYRVCTSNALPLPDVFEYLAEGYAQHAQDMELGGSAVRGMDDVDVAADRSSVAGATTAAGAAAAAAAAGGPRAEAGAGTWAGAPASVAAPTSAATPSPSSASSTSSSAAAAAAARAGAAAGTGLAVNPFLAGPSGGGAAGPAGGAAGAAGVGGAGAAGGIASPRDPFGGYSAGGAGTGAGASMQPLTRRTGGKKEKDCAIM